MTSTLAFDSHFQFDEPAFPQKAGSEEEKEILRARDTNCVGGGRPRIASGTSHGRRAVRLGSRIPLRGVFRFRLPAIVAVGRISAFFSARLYEHFCDGGVRASQKAEAKAGRVFACAFCRVPSQEEDASGHKNIMTQVQTRLDLFLLVLLNLLVLLKFKLQVRARR